MAVAITASMAHKVEKEFLLAPNEIFEVGPFALKLEKIFEYENTNYQALAAKVLVLKRKDLSSLGVLNPELRQYTRNQETTTEVALRMGLLQDLYLVLAGTDDDGVRAAFKVFINPLQIWLWIGTIIVLIGTVINLLPSERNRRWVDQKE